jgi:hypothetical protein
MLRIFQGELVFYVNGMSQGVAADDLPARVYAVVDLYGKCAQVTIVDSEISGPDCEREFSNVFLAHFPFLRKQSRLMRLLY